MIATFTELVIPYVIDRCSGFVLPIITIAGEDGWSVV